MQSGRWLCIGPQVARLRPSSRADILLETRPLIFSGFFSGPSAGCGTGPRKKPGRRQAAPPFRGPAVACLPKKSEGRQNRQNASVLWVLQNRPKQNRTGGWGLVLLCLVQSRRQWMRRRSKACCGNRLGSGRHWIRPGCCRGAALHRPPAGRFVATGAKLRGDPASTRRERPSG